ncbi:MAG: AI-2E family transporter [Thermodesulfobacteriota bacterium]
MHESPPSPMVLRYFLVLFLVVLLLLGLVLWPFLSILVFSYLLTSMFHPLYEAFNRRLPATLASLLTCLVIVLIVFIPLAIFVAAFSQEALHIYELGKSAKIGMKLQSLQDSVLYDRIQAILLDMGVYVTPETISEAVTNLTRRLGLYLYEQASAWAANIMHFFINFALMIMTIFFLLIDQERLFNYLLRLSPLPDDQDRRLFKKFDETTTAVFIGNGVTSVVQGVICGIIFAIFQLGPPVVWGVISAILAFLPIVGIGLVLIPAAAIQLVQGDVQTAVLVVVLYVLVTIVIEYVMKTKMVGDQTQIHSLLVLLAIMGGLNTFGLLGIVYGPLIVSAFLTLADIYVTSYDKYVKSSGTER